ncbi:hypothetical protein LTR78_001146 [Recurvomyces mirabilis]|uniref:Uncharacterized protein n=1 Tax=Recurvomyces mirabilis TaxID=574656 RepID=A0AAE0WVF7_9PEZI|nr:hypothetical protein LTR78_001146 [Recurvomyces mirabilis]KAK5161122.1 hypothetical protein LTS14_000918 [Recurvomyces mirabilis]
MAPTKQQQKGKGRARAAPESLDWDRYLVEEETAPPRLPQYLRTPAEALLDTDDYRAYQERQSRGEQEEAAAPRRTSSETRAAVGHVRGGDDEDADELVFVNIGEAAAVPAGLGLWHWLQADVDGIRAAELGFDHPAQVEHARNQSLFANGLGFDAGPITLWYPRRELFNPRHQPDGPGRWAYHTPADQQTADLNMGGQADDAGRYDFTNVPHPTAAQVWAARRRSVDAGEPPNFHQSRDVNVVWVPGTDDQEVGEQEAEQQMSDGEDGEVGRVTAGQIDPVSGVVHDPLNRGENDQTAPDDDLATYHTREIAGKVFTLDRMRAHAGPPTPRLAWILTKKGVWQKYSGYEKVDWTKETSVESLNKWKEQALNRNGWPSKRGDRPTYPDDQREWMLEYVKGKKLPSSSIALHELAAAFDERFDSKRPVTGLYGLMTRIRGELDKYGGLQPDRLRRGDNLRRKRSEEESEGESSAGEGPSKKARKKAKK